MQTDAHALRRKAAFFFTAPRRDGKRRFLPGGQRARLSKTQTSTHTHGFSQVGTHDQHKCGNEKL